MPFLTRSRIGAQSRGFGQVDVDVLLATGLDERICWESSGRMPLGPQRALEAGVGATLVGQVTGGLDGEVADGFHGLVGRSRWRHRNRGRCAAGTARPGSHDAQAHRAVLEVGVLRLRRAVVVDVDDVIEHAHSGAHGALQLAASSLPSLMWLTRLIEPRLQTAISSPCWCSA